MTPEELEERIRHAMATETMTPGTGMWEQIASAAGVPGPRIGLRRWLMAAALLLILGGGSWFYLSRGAPSTAASSMGRPPAPEPHDTPFFLTPTPAYAQVIGNSRGPLRPGHWVYAPRGRVFGSSTDSSHSTFALSRGEYAGNQVWMLVSGRVRNSGVLAADTLWATSDSLKPLARVWTTSSGRIEQTWREHDVLTGTTINGYTSWQTSTLVDSATSNHGALLRMPDIAMWLHRAEFNPAWRGSIPMQGTSSDGTYAKSWLNVRVDGEEEVETPAGKFLCWRVRTVFGPDDDDSRPLGEDLKPGIYFWVSKDRGWLIKQAFINRSKSPYMDVLVEGEQEH